MEIVKDQVYVCHVGNDDKDIKGTGEKRQMGKVQFEEFGKKNGWAIVPETDAKEETASTDSSKETTPTGAKTSMDFVPSMAITEIKTLGEAGELEAITEFVANESREAVLSAANHFTNPAEEAEDTSTDATPKENAHPYESTEGATEGGQA